MALKDLKICPLKKIIYNEKWKLEKTPFERYKNNTAIGVDYLTFKNYTSKWMSERRVPLRL